MLELITLQESPSLMTGFSGLVKYRPRENPVIIICQWINYLSDCSSNTNPSQDKVANTDNKHKEFYVSR